MLDALKPLIENELFSADDKVEIQEQWDKTLLEAKDSIRTELREEFAQRYEHDKSVMVEALDKMVTDGLTSEIAEFNEEKAAMAVDRVKHQKKMYENVAKFNNFMTAKLAEEITELRKDRAAQKNGLVKLEAFTAKHLAKEIREFANDKRDLVNTKVKLVAEASQKFKLLKKKFVAESSKKVKIHVAEQLMGELNSLNEDIKAARENSFGRRIFEAFSSEFTSTHLNENAVIRKLKKTLAHKNQKLKESVTVAKKFKTLTESKQKEIRNIKDTESRKEILDELVGPLNEEKAKIMNSLLENVQTNRLNKTFEKYLPAVLANKEVRTASKKAVLAESVKSVSGNKTAKPSSVSDDSNIIDMKRLAGL